MPGGPLTGKPTWFSTLGCRATSVLFFGAHASVGNRRRKDLIMLSQLMPFLADYIWIGGGTLGLIVVVVLVVMLVRRA